MDEPHYNYGMKALEIADKLIDFELSSDEAFEQLGALMDSKALLPETEYGDEFHFSNSGIESNVLYLHSEILYLRIGDSDLDSIMEKRNALAQCLGE